MSILVSSLSRSNVFWSSGYFNEIQAQCICMEIKVTQVLQLTFRIKKKNVVSFWQCPFHCYQSMSKCCNFQPKSCRGNQTDRENERHFAGFQNYEVEGNSASSHHGKGIFRGFINFFGWYVVWITIMSWLLDSHQTSYTACS